MSVNDHGNCPHCGYDLNGDYIYDTFLKMYNGDVDKALEVSSQYGASKGKGRWGKAVYMTSYSDGYTKKEKYWQCPECEGVW